MVKSSNLGAKSLKVRALLQRQIAKLASGLLCCWSYGVTITHGNKSSNVFFKLRSQVFYRM